MLLSNKTSHISIIYRIISFILSLSPITHNIYQIYKMVKPSSTTLSPSSFGWMMNNVIVSVMVMMLITIVVVTGSSSYSSSPDESGSGSTNTILDMCNPDTLYDMMDNIGVDPSPKGIDRLGAYGSWYSPWTTKLATSNQKYSLETYEPTKDFAFWLEVRPTEQGRFVPVQVDNNNNYRDLIPIGYNARSSVYEYGGTPIVFLNYPRHANDQDFKVVFINEDQALYLHYPHRDKYVPLRLTPPVTTRNTTMRFVDGTHDKKRNRIVYICEEHFPSPDNPEEELQQALNYLCSIDLRTKEIKIIEQGRDFYSYPRFNHDFSKVNININLTWISWSFPNMPWDDTELYVGNIHYFDGSLTSKYRVSWFNESVIDPKWGIGDDRDSLYYISDISEGYWAIHKHNSISKTNQLIQSPKSLGYIEIGEPIWYFGRSFYDLLPNKRIMATGDKYIIDIKIGMGFEKYENEMSIGRSIKTQKQGVGCRDEYDCSVTILGGSPTQTTTLVRLLSSPRKSFQNNQNNQNNSQQQKVKVGVQVDVSSIRYQDKDKDKKDTYIIERFGFPYECNRQTGQCKSVYLLPYHIEFQPLLPLDTYDSRFISIPVLIKFATSDGHFAYGYYYPPTNPLYTNAGQISNASNKPPPLLVKSHGGPTDSAEPVLNMKFQYWTSRGIGILDVNYRGSSGYGRQYRELLNTKWGIYDVDDCCNGAKYLVENGFASNDSLLIDGGSAGGFTTLASLTFRDVFKGGSSFFGIGDLDKLAQQSRHKFEFRYADKLVGDYKEQRQLFYDRSPIRYVSKLKVPVAFFHGADDMVVDPNQSREMYEHLKAIGIPTLLEIYQGEDHGFVQEKNLQRSLDGEHFFFSKILGFEAKCLLHNDFNIVNLNK
ncbi:hypothetical protein DFA_01827 [Cavenderia fasciculata]|uniref:Peptidase S9 prolyl oligopeptidase catalytic domain-containing protein n=1 Tax=Cavenderia fasciculata TaxID=261658 RepID=F4PUX9_CACFS|nr:uncharacterized protein DFA_01827 [Cavenderia fasciculata]EGG21941.1 hypothetical protein DFA_01827 [Cavenderia fasciculata]|eukprot:XP_004359792.1 hypothetical protein DFA_01827 [Cavenderia fasciculata]